MNAREKEIRRILNGYYLINDANRMEVGADLRDVQQIQEGFIASQIFGLKIKTKKYDSELSGKKLSAELTGALEKYGIPVDLHTEPDVLTLYVASGFSENYILTAETEDRSLLLTVYMKKGLLSPIRIRRIFRKWSVLLEELKLTECEEAAPTQAQTTKKEHKNRERKEK